MHVAGVFMPFQKLALDKENMKRMKLSLFELGIYRWLGRKERTDKREKFLNGIYSLDVLKPLHLWRTYGNFFCRGKKIEWAMTGNAL